VVQIRVPTSWIRKVCLSKSKTLKGSLVPIYICLVEQRFQLTIAFVGVFLSNKNSLQLAYQAEKATGAQRPFDRTPILSSSCGNDEDICTSAPKKMVPPVRVPAT